MKIVRFILITITLASLTFLIGCGSTTEIVEDPLVTPFSIGPNGTPSVTPPTTNPPNNE